MAAPPFKPGDRIWIVLPGIVRGSAEHGHRVVAQVPGVQVDAREAPPLLELPRHAVRRILQ